MDNQIKYFQSNELPFMTSEEKLNIESQKRQKHRENWRKRHKSEVNFLQKYNFLQEPVSNFENQLNTEH